MSVFKEITRLTARWAPAEGEGLEHLTIEAVAGGYRAKSVVVGSDFGLSYEIDIDRDWSVRSFSLEATDGRSLSNRSPKPGEWIDASGNPMPAVHGCIDIDLSFSCFTNTLPVRRTDIAKGEAREFTMLYVLLDTLDPFPDGQRYTGLEPPRRFLYEATDGAFSGEIEFDEYGLVTDFPGLFHRVA